MFGVTTYTLLCCIAKSYPPRRNISTGHVGCKWCWLLSTGAKKLAKRFFSVDPSRRDNYQRAEQIDIHQEPGAPASPSSPVKQPFNIPELQLDIRRPPVIALT